ncbi:MAG: AmmeMemoRadiSam system radical SAM enzyme [Nitrososphaeria archaeon]|nr:AmmeMemoRadiSam system radical SAM enzyme [Nitrososphaeria archaeon]
MKIEAKLYEKVNRNKTRCLVCAHKCVIKERRFGVCGTRVNEDGILYTLIYGSLTAEAVDPVEKKPLFHFWPGSETYSISSVGCNFACPWCQNWHISAKSPGDTSVREVQPEEIAYKVKEMGLNSISYTYNEPSIWFEYLHDLGKLAHEKEVANILVTNGYFSFESLSELRGLIDAANVDIKGFTENLYKRYPKARLEHVLGAVEEMRNQGVHLELTLLVIPGLNDEPGEAKKFIKWTVNSLGENVPVHLSRFFPHYKYGHLSPTPIETLVRLRDIAKESGLNYVYIGNVPGRYEDTECPSCGETVISRRGFQIIEWRLGAENKCKKCGTEIPLIGEQVKRRSGFWPFY